MARTIAEGQAMVQAVRQNQVVLQVGQQQRNDPIFRLALDMVPTETWETCTRSRWA